MAYVGCCHCQKWQFFINNLQEVAITSELAVTILCKFLLGTALCMVNLLHKKFECFQESDINENAT